MIEVEALSKRYRDHVAVEGLSFRVERGEIVGFLGPNGAGKSTTMRMLVGVLPPTSGRARIAGVDVFDDPVRVKERVGYLPEIPPVYVDMTVAEYLAFVARLKGVRGVPAGAVGADGGVGPDGRDLPPPKTEVERVARLAGVEHILGRLIGNVSKGYRQRVGLAQALIGSPEVLVLDEPTVGLDPIQIEQVRRLVLALGRSKKHTIILSTHILGEVKAVCDRVIILARGRIAADAPLATLEAEHGASLETVFTRLAAA
jgi:ABC-2 type transport system ATP-binding protein